MSRTSETYIRCRNPNCSKVLAKNDGIKCRCGTVTPILEQDSIITGTVVSKNQYGAKVEVRGVAGFLRIQDPKELSCLQIGNDMTVRVVSPPGKKLWFLLPNEDLLDFFNTSTGTWTHISMIDWIFEEHDGKSGDCECCADESNGTPFVLAVATQKAPGEALSLFPK